MLSHWLIAVPKNVPADRAVADRVEAMLASSLCYRPDGVLFHRMGHGIWVLCVSAGTRTWGMDWPFVLNESDFLAVGGVPTLEALDGAVGTVPERLSFAHRSHGPQWMHDNIGGTFSIGAIDVRAGGDVATVTAFSDFSGYSSCYCLDSGDYFVVGNRASFVGAFRPGFPGENEIDTKSLGWLVGTTMIMGTGTPFAGVTRLRSGSMVSVSVERTGAVGAVRRASMSPGHFEPIPNASIEAMDIEGFCSRIGRRIRWCAREGIRFRAHLTGGRDTRVVAGILANQGCLDAVERFNTSGTEQNGDVVVARKLARTLGLDARHTVTKGTKGAHALTAEEVSGILLRSPVLYDCQLTPFDGRRFLVPKLPEFATLMGGGGEVYRQEYGSPGALDGGDAPERALRMFSKYDPLDLLSDEAKQAQLAEIESELDLLRESGVANMPCAFYVEERLSNWGCGHFNNAASAQFPLLLDKEVARWVLSIEDVSEHVHFEILRYCGDHLLDVPFLNHPWAAGTQERAKRLGLAPEPIRIPLERSFPWQFDCYRRFRDAVIDFCMECGGGLRDQVPLENLERLRRTPLGSFGSPHIKMLFGLCGAILLTENAWAGERDCGDGEETRFRGNRHLDIRLAVLEERAGADSVADELRDRIARADR